MNGQEAIRYIKDNGKWGVCLGLKTIRILMRYLGDPQDDLKYVHVAGTNGKGSIATMTAAVLTAAGYTTGLFTSPALLHFNERIQINMRPIENDDLAASTEDVRRAVTQMTTEGYDHPFGFEIETAIALVFFKRKQADICVMEVGMGGRLDATNVIPAPVVAVIAHISFDHTEYLGNTLSKIAGEKAGIIKPGCTVVAAPQCQDVSTVIKRKAEVAGVPIIETDPETLTVKQATFQGQRMHCNLSVIPELSDFTLNLLGNYQRYNAATVLNIIGILQKNAFTIKEEAIVQAFQVVTFPGRFERISQRPLVVIDGAHNPDGIKTLTDNIHTYFSGKKIHLYFGMLADKDIRTSLMLLIPEVDQITVMAPFNDRALPADKMAALIKKNFQKDVMMAYSPEEAVRQIALDDVETVHLFTGSLYIIGFVKQAWLSLADEHEM